jgi:hypothetical protein
MASSILQFQTQLSNYFRELILAHAYLQIGNEQIAKAPLLASVSVLLGEDITTEPFILKELVQHSSAVNDGLLELFQTKVIAAWSDLLSALFSDFIAQHLAGEKLYPQFKKITARLDFSAASCLEDQLKEALISDFAFKPYKDKIAPISAILDPTGLMEEERSLIKKHVLIRNAIQHHESKVYDELLKELGTVQLAILDVKGNPLSIVRGQRIPLSIPELDALKSALFRLTNKWREIYA